MAIWAVRLTGLLVLLGFIALCSFIHVPRIEADLREKAVSALKAEGIGGVEVSASGRDIALRDESGVGNPLDQATSIVAAIPGVRQVKPLAAGSTDSDSSVTRNNGLSFSVSKTGPEEVLLRGEFPSDMEKADIVNTVAAGGVKVNAAGLKPTSVRIKGAPEIFTVVAAASKELAAGHISIEGNSIRVLGKPLQPNGSESIKEKLGPFLGLGYTLEFDVPTTTEIVAESAPANPEARDVEADATLEDSGEGVESGMGPLTGGVAQQRCQQQVNNILASRQLRFANGRATLRNSSIAILNKLADALSGCPDLNITITGYTDSTGKPAGNIRLSQQRADAVKAYLVSKGVKTEKIKTEGKGAADPIASNKTAAGRSRNRRIEMTLEGVKQ